MKLVVDHWENVTVVRLEGKLTMSDAEELTKCVDSCLGSGQLRIVIDIEAVPYVDSIGLGELVRAAARARKAGGILVLANPVQRLVDQLSITRLADVFVFSNSLAEAIRMANG